MCVGRSAVGVTGPHVGSWRTLRAGLSASDPGRLWFLRIGRPGDVSFFFSIISLFHDTDCSLRASQYPLLRRFRERPWKRRGLRLPSCWTPVPRSWESPPGPAHRGPCPPLPTSNSGCRPARGQLPVAALGIWWCVAAPTPLWCWKLRLLRRGPSCWVGGLLGALTAPPVSPSS